MRWNIATIVRDGYLEHLKRFILLLILPSRNKVNSSFICSENTDFIYIFFSWGDTSVEKVREIMTALSIHKWDWGSTWTFEDCKMTKRFNSFHTMFGNSTTVYLTGQCKCAILRKSATPSIWALHYYLVFTKMLQNPVEVEKK